MMKTQMLIAAMLVCAGATAANAQIVATPGPPVLWGPPVVTQYAPPAAGHYAPPTVTYYAPRVTVRRPVGTVVAPVAPAPVSAYYAPAPVAPVTVYHAPAPAAVPVTAPPVTTYYAPAPAVRPLYMRRGLFGRYFVY